MSEAAVSGVQMIMRRASLVLDDTKRRFPELNDVDRVMAMTLALGMAIGEQSFPERPEFDLMMLMRVIGSAVGVQLARLQEAEKAACVGRAEDGDKDIQRAEIDSRWADF